MFDVLRGSTPRSVTTTDGGKLQGAAGATRLTGKKARHHQATTVSRGGTAAHSSWSPGDPGSTMYPVITAPPTVWVWERFALACYGNRTKGEEGCRGGKATRFLNSRAPKPSLAPTHLTLTSPAQASRPLPSQAAAGRAYKFHRAPAVGYGRMGLRGGGWVDGGHHASPEKKNEK